MILVLLVSVDPVPASEMCCRHQIPELALVLQHKIFYKFAMADMFWRKEQIFKLLNENKTLQNNN